LRRHDVFSGADIGEFSGPPREAEYRQLFARIEGFDVPVVAGLFGTAADSRSRSPATIKWPWRARASVFRG
jgi:hypothetical protein